MRYVTFLLSFLMLPLAFPLILSAQNCPSDDVIEADVLDGSSVSIEGSSTLHGWTVDANQFNVIFCVPTNWFDSPDNWENGEVDRLAVRVPVEHLDGGKNKMNRDLREALKYDEHKEIRFDWQNIRLSGKTDIGRLAEVEGTVEIAGVRRAVTFDADLSYSEWNQIVAKGSVPLRMTDFDVKPPTALFGIIRTDDEIDVTFEIYFSVDRGRRVD